MKNLPARAAALASALLVAGALWPSTADAFSFYLTDDQRPLHQRVDVLEWVTAPDTGSGPAAALIDGLYAEALAAWAELPCRPFAVGAGGVGECGGEVAEDGLNCLWWSDDPDTWPYGRFEIANTALHFDGRTGEIVGSDIALNGGRFDFATADVCQSGTVDLRVVLLHEAGHVMGLNHSTDADATMAVYSSSSDCDKRDLSADDRDGYCELYDAAALLIDPAPEGSDGCAGGAASLPSDPIWAALVLVWMVLPGLRRRAQPRVAANAG